MANGLRAVLNFRSRGERRKSRKVACLSDPRIGFRILTGRELIRSAHRLKVDLHQSRFLANIASRGLYGSRTGLSMASSQVRDGCRELLRFAHRFEPPVGEGRPDRVCVASLSDSRIGLSFLAWARALSMRPSRELIRFAHRFERRRVAGSRGMHRVASLYDSRIGFSSCLVRDS